MATTYGTQDFKLYCANTAKTIDVRVQWYESYDDSTNISTVGINDVLLKQTVASGTQYITVSGAIWMAGVKCAQKADTNMQLVYDTWTSIGATWLANGTVQHDSSTGAATTGLAIAQYSTAAGFWVYMGGYNYYSGAGGYASEYTVSLTTHPRGLVYIDNGSSFAAYQAFIDNGSSWSQYKAYIDNGSSWVDY